MTDQHRARIKAWAEKRDLTGPENLERQALKLVEEVGELAEAILKNKTIGTKRDCFGDIEVVLEILALKMGINREVALDRALEEIERRTGYTKDGIFIKNDEY